MRGYTPDWLDWAINERTLDWIVQLVFNFTKKKLEDYMAKKSVETTTVARFGKAGDYIRFVPIDEAEYKRIKELVERGEYQCTVHEEA